MGFVPECDIWELAMFGSSNKPRYEAFICYRPEDGGAEARLILQSLIKKGRRVFLDVRDTNRGRVLDTSVLTYISKIPTFIVILSPHALDRTVEEGDWFRREIAHAIETKRNIIPVVLPGFTYPSQLPDDIRPLQRYMGVVYSDEFLNAMADRIVEMMVPSRSGVLLRRIVELSTVVAAATGMLSLFDWIGAFHQISQVIPPSVIRLVGVLFGAVIGYLGGRLRRTENR